MKKLQLLDIVCACLMIFITMPADALLIDNGEGLIYDNVLDITWAQPGNIRMTWNEANTWAAGLELGGGSGWRLPYISVAAGVGPYNDAPVRCETATETDCRDNELGYMFYHNLGGTYDSPILTSSHPNLDLFPMLLNEGYWSGTKYANYYIPMNQAWLMQFTEGRQGHMSVGLTAWAWAVHDGDVVPEPPIVLLLATGLLGIILASRKKIAK